MTDRPQFVFSPWQHRQDIAAIVEEALECPIEVKRWEAKRRALITALKPYAESNGIATEEDVWFQDATHALGQDILSAVLPMLPPITLDALDLNQSSIAQWAYALQRLMRGERSNETMNSAHEQNLLRTAKTIADHLTYAANYVGTLRGLQKHTCVCPEVLDRIGHFIGTIHTAVWFELLLKLSHCSDEQKSATGFPKLFKQLLTYLPEKSEFRPTVKAQKQRLHALDLQKKVKNWRNEVIAHHTITDNFHQTKSSD